MSTKREKNRNLNYGIFSPKFESSCRLKLGKNKIQNSKYLQSLLSSPLNYTSNTKYSTNNSNYISPIYTKLYTGIISPIRKNSKLKKSTSQKNIKERFLSITARSYPTVLNNFRIIRSPIYKTTIGNKSSLYNTSNENTKKNKYFNLETEKLYQETRQIKKLVRYLTNELIILKRENEEKDKQITIKEKEINNIIIKNNSLIIGQNANTIETINDIYNTNSNINKINNESNNNIISDSNTNSSINISKRTNDIGENTEENSYSNLYNDSIYINALSSNRNSSTGNLFFRIKKEIKLTNNEMKKENDKFKQLKKSVYATKMNELNIESIILNEEINKIKSLLDNAYNLNKKNELKNEEILNIEKNIENQNKIENNMILIINRLEKEESELKEKHEKDKYNLTNKIKEVNININKLIFLRKKNENLINDKVIKDQIFIKRNGNPIQINSLYKNRIRELKKSIKFYLMQIKHSNDELNKLKEKRKKLIETEKIKGLKINLNMDLTKKEDEKVNIILKKDNNYNKDNMNNKNEEEKIKKLKEDLIKAKEIEKKYEEKVEKYFIKLRELELIEEEKERQKQKEQEKEELNNQSQIEFGIDSENPFYTEEEGNIPEVSLKFTSSQFNQFTYVLFKNFEAKGIIQEESKNKIINPFYDYMVKNNVSIIEYTNTEKFKEVMSEFTKIIMNSLNNNNTYNFTLINIFISALFYNTECDINKLIKYFNILFSYTKNYLTEEEKYISKLKNKYQKEIKKLIDCIKNYIDSNKNNNKEYFPLLKMKEILDKNEINLKDKYIEFLFYYLKKFEDSDSKLIDLKFDLFENIIPIMDKNKEIEEENNYNNSNNFNNAIKDSEIKDINDTYKNEETSKKEESNIMDILDKKSDMNLTSQKNEIKSPTEEDFSKRQKRKKKNMEKKEKKKEKENSDDFEEEEDSMTEITNEEYIKQLTEALKIMQKGLQKKNITFEELMTNVVQKRKITGIFYDCISIEDFNEQFKNLDIILSDLKLSCLCSKYSIPNELRLIDKNKISKDIEKQAKGILKFEEEEDDEDNNFT